MIARQRFAPFLPWPSDAGGSGPVAGCGTVSGRPDKPAGAVANHGHERNLGRKVRGSFHGQRPFCLAENTTFDRTHANVVESNSSYADRFWLYDRPGGR